VPPAPRPAYDRLGVGYRGERRPEPRWQAAVDAALEGCATVANVGAGAGSYEPAGTVVAVEPSPVMLAQRPPGAAPAVRGVAEALPLPDGAVDAALVVLSVHHWTDQAAGLAELRRISRRQVVFTFDPHVHDPFWLIDEYLPEITEVPHSTRLPSPEQLAEALGGGEVRVLPVPHDCADGVLWAGWRRPERYLAPAVLAAASATADLLPAVRAAGVERLRADLASGAWHRRHADLLARDEIDGGYRLVVAGERGR